MVRTAIQLFTLKDLDASVPVRLERIGETAFDGVEFYDAHFDAFQDETVLHRTQDALTDTGLEVAGAHIGIDRLESMTNEVIDTCHTLGCSTLVIPTYERDAFATRESIQRAADRIGELAAILNDRNLELLYHNHTFEFEKVDGAVAFELFVEAAAGRFKFEPDVGLATHAGYDPLELLETVADRAPVVHLTDSIPDDSDAVHADPGTGVVDLEACARAAAIGGAEWFVCENGRTSDPIESLERGSDAFVDLRDRTQNL